MVHDAVPGKPVCLQCGSGEIDLDEFGISCLDCGYSQETGTKVGSKKCPKCKSIAKLILYRSSSAIVCKECGFDERIELETGASSKSGTKSRSPYRTGGSARSQKKAH